MGIIVDSKGMHSTEVYFAVVILAIGLMTLSPCASVVRAAGIATEETIEASNEIVDPGVRASQNEDEEGAQKDQQEAEQEDVAPKVESPGVVKPEAPNGVSETGAEVTSEVKPEVKPEESVQSQGTDTPRIGLYGGRVFGSTKIHFAVNKSEFGVKQKCYQKIYGDSNPNLSVGADWFPKDWAINPGFMFKMAAFSAHGKALKGSAAAGASCSQLTADENSHTSLQYTPIQAGLKVEMSPFRRKGVVFDLWAAGEYGFWQETRDAAVGMIRSVVTGQMNANSGPSMATKSTSTKVYTNSGAKTGVSTGLALHILMNPLDEAEVHTMVPSMGLGFVYLSFFAESVSSISSGLSFARNSFGVGFTFESVK